MAADVAHRVIKYFRQDGFEELSFFGGELLHPSLPTPSLAKVRYSKLGLPAMVEVGKPRPGA